MPWDGCIYHSGLMWCFIFSLYWACHSRQKCNCDRDPLWVQGKSCFNVGENLKLTRKSCVNARGILTAAYQVLPKMGYSPPPGRGIPEVEYPPAGVPPNRSDGGYLRWVPPGRGTPSRGNPPLPWLDLAGDNPLSHLDLAGVPPSPTRCGQTDWWMDRHVSKHNFPSYYVRGR